MNDNVRFIVDGLVLFGIVHANEYVAAAAVDDILGLEPVEVVGGILSFFQKQELFGVDLGVLVRKFAVSVADGNEREAQFVEFSLTVVSDVPAEHAFADLVIFMSLALPFVGSKAAERRQVAVIFFAHRFQLAKSLVDFRTLHGKSPFRNWICT